MFPLVRIILDFIREFAFVLFVILIAYIAYVLVDFQEMIEANAEEIQKCVRTDQLDKWIIEHTDDIEEMHATPGRPRTVSEVNGISS